tara:strand:+ start:97 stop:1869 length:1773 start_codon:yes stop_codon:yes gene_type:complete
MASLAEINKTLKEQTSAIEYGNRGTDDLRMKFGAFVDGIKGGAGDRREQEIEAQRASRAGRARAAGPRGMARGFGAGLGGLLGGLGGMGKFAAMLGIAGLAAMQFLDGEKIKKNVETILSIGERYKEDTVKTLFSDGATILALKGLGLGLLVFSAGGAAAAGVDALDKKTMDKYETSTGWSENVKTNVLTLLSISNGVKETMSNLAKGATFPLAMLGLSAGLGIFAAGQALSVTAEAFTTWAGAGNWAQNIKDNVITLLSISDIAFSTDTVKFGAAMLAISGALLGFGVASATVGLADFLADWAADGKGRQDWTEELKKNVKNVLSITDLTNEGKADQFVKGLVKISGGLLAFATAEFLGALVSASKNILAFFFKAESPFEQIMKVAKNADDLEKGATAVDSLTVSLDKLGKLKFRGDRINMKEFALDLADSIKVIETALEGGTFDASWLPFDGKKIKGLNSPEIDYATAIRNIENLRAALRVGVGPNNILDRYGNTFQFPTSLETIPASGSGSGLSNFMMKPAADGRGKKRIRRGFEENALDALAQNGFKLDNPIQYNQTINQDNRTSNSSQTNTVITGSTTDESLQLN